MKFSELKESEQNLLIDELENIIEREAENENIANYKFPSFEEYCEFFDAYDKDYEIIDGYPESVLVGNDHSIFEVVFEEEGAVSFNVYERDDR